MRKRLSKKQGSQRPAGVPPVEATGVSGEAGGQGSRGAREQGSRKGLNPLTASLPYFIALTSGILMGLTVAPVNAWPLAWVALAPLWVLVVNFTKQEKHSLPSPLLPCSLLWGIGYHCLALSWVTGIHPMTWMGVPWLASIAIALFCLTFITLWGAALVAVWATCMALISRSMSVTTRVLIGTALWCGLESLWSAGPLWWSSLSYTQSPYNLAILHLGQLSGPTTVTAAIVAVNGLIAESWLNRPNTNLTSSWRSNALKRFATLGRTWRYPVGLLISLHIIGFALYIQPLIEPPATALKVGIIQGNVPNEIKLYPEGFRRAIEGYTTGYKTLASQGVDAVLTPEGALPFMWSEVMRSSFYSAVLEKGVVAWVGAFGASPRETDVRSITNSLFTLTGDGQIFSRYNKVKQVPIGEYIPFEQFLGSLIKRLSPLDEHQVAGSPTQLFDTPFGRAIVVICYGSAFPEQFRYQAEQGGQFILSPSNDAHFSPAMPAQHHAQDVMRAIETDRWALRATNTGYSAVVDPHGRTLWISRLHAYEIHATTIYRRQNETLYVRWGDWMMPVLLVLGTIAWLLNAASTNYDD